MQTQLQFTTHHRENNSRSESHLNAHRKHFSKQCTEIYELLKSGRKLTVREAVLELKINSLPRRVADLRAGGIQVLTEPVPGTNCVRYYIPQP